MDLPYKIQIGKLSTNKSLVDFSLVTFGEHDVEAYKIMAEVREYGEGGRGTKTVANAFMDIEEMDIIVHDILHNTFHKTWDKAEGDAGEYYKYEVYGGGRKDGRPWARNFQIAYDIKKSRYIVRIREGEGQKNKTGGIILREEKVRAITYQSLPNMRKLAKKIERFIDALHNYEMHPDKLRLWDVFNPEKDAQNG